MQRVVKEWGTVVDRSLCDVTDMGLDACFCYLSNIHSDSDTSLYQHIHLYFAEAEDVGDFLNGISVRRAIVRGVK
jgi:hypothetical protein